MEKFTKLYSGTVAGTGNNNAICLKGGKKYVLESRYKLRAEGECRFKLFFANIIESTGNFRRDTPGSEYVIKKAYAKACGREKEMTFGGSAEKRVLPGEEFSSDEFTLFYDKDEFMELIFEVEAESDILLPSTYESTTRGRVFEDTEAIYTDGHSLRPYFIGIYREFEKTVGFFGDSITQGTSTTEDAYEAWAHRIGNSLSDSVSFYNIGMGWSRAYDAAGGGIFLKKASMCDEVFVCFGVNDIGSGGRKAIDVIADLETIKRELRGVKMRFLTIPPFNFAQKEECERKKVNAYIRKTPEYFDIASVLEDGEEGRIKREFMAGADDPHPNGVAGEAVFNAFLRWRAESEW